jgi:hypothetical protein
MPCGFDKAPPKDCDGAKELRSEVFDQRRNVRVEVLQRQTSAKAEETTAGAAVP